MGNDIKVKPLPVVEHFMSIQGEGKFAGTRSLFIRFGGCNLQCKGFGVSYKTPDGKNKVGCDSFYAVDMAFKNEWQYYDNEHDLYDAIVAPHWRIDSPLDIVLTGGEPLIHLKNKIFVNLISKALLKDNFITIETNGATEPFFGLAKHGGDLAFSISPKLASAGNTLKYNFDYIGMMMDFYPHSYLKFVVDPKNAAENMIEITNIMKKAKVSSDRIYLMPLGETVDMLNINAGIVADLALRFRMNYSDRLHIRLWNNARGV